MNKNVSCNTKNVVYVIECCKCKKVDIGSTQTLNNRVTLHRSNIKLLENRKHYVSKHLYECSNGMFKIKSIYQTDDDTLLQIKEKYFIDKFIPTLNRIELYTYWHTTEDLMHTLTTTNIQTQTILTYFYDIINSKKKKVEKQGKRKHNHIYIYVYRHKYSNYILLDTKKIILNKSDKDYRTSQNKHIICILERATTSETRVEK